MTIKNRLPMALRAAYLALHRRSDAEFARYGVTADQFVLLAVLEQGRALTQRELALRMSSDPSTVRAMLVLLEKQGWVRRDSHPSDSRARTAALTATGKRKLRRLWEAGEPIRTRLLESLPEGQAESLVMQLLQIAAALDPDTTPPADPHSRSIEEDLG